MKLLLQLNNSLKNIFHELLWNNTSRFMDWDSKTATTSHMRTKKLKQTQTSKKKKVFRVLLTFIPARERTLLSLYWPDWTGVVYMRASLN